MLDIILNILLGYAVLSGFIVAAAVGMAAYIWLEASRTRWPR